DGGTNGAEGGGFGMSPKLGVIGVSASSQLLCSEAIAVSSSKSTWMETDI
ncbi:hypothetical protein Tco_0483203, partial [Tanacetum coccineum]